ncbi:cyclin-A1-2-like isoform X2 [Phragmites australis]|uniref:cyclin-A1-2-like isoform X2 n=1 Tax=Phragmites australis TaxID=29695 RepID=UPI002D7A3DCF|nr:cyclin-A1-2-like isoform X2 [Phragmites australis]
MSSIAASRRSSSATAKRPAMAESAGGPKAPGPDAAQAKKRVALGNITNVAAGGGRKVAPLPGTAKLNSAASGAPVKKGSLASARSVSSIRGSAVKSASTKPAPPLSRYGSTTQKQNVPPPKVPTIVHVPNRIPALAPCSSFVSPGRSEDSVSVDETMSICDSMKSPDFEYIDNGDSSMLASLQRRANEHLRISDDRDAEETKWKKNAPAPTEMDSICDVDNDFEDPQLCATLASDIYMHLREAETRKRPSTDFMEMIQKDVNPSMRAILIDWLVEVAEEYRLVPDTLYLTVNYIDRYLSGNEINRQRLQLLGVACMLIAAKYEEICAPQVEEFCYITDNTYFRDEVLEMEASVLNYLKFEMTAPTAKCFLRRFARAAQVCDEDPALHLEFVANYVSELSLLEYNLLSYPPSLIAASAIFLAKFILQPTKYPWNSTLAHYTQYKPSELCDCVKALHRLFSVGPGRNLPAIREKYSQHKYKFAAKKHCPPSIPTEFFRDATC